MGLSELLELVWGIDTRALGKLRSFSAKGGLGYGALLPKVICPLQPAGAARGWHVTDEGMLRCEVAPRFFHDPIKNISMEVHMDDLHGTGPKKARQDAQIVCAV